MIIRGGSGGSVATRGMWQLVGARCNQQPLSSVTGIIIEAVVHA